MTDEANWTRMKALKRAARFNEVAEKVEKRAYQLRSNSNISAVDSSKNDAKKKNDIKKTELYAEKAERLAKEFRSKEEKYRKIANYNKGSGKEENQNKQTKDALGGTFGAKRTKNVSASLYGKGLYGKERER